MHIWLAAIAPAGGYRIKIAKSYYKLLFSGSQL